MPLGERASRLMSERPAAKAQPKQAAQPEVARLSPEARQSRWKSMTLRLLIVLRTFAFKKYSQMMLGTDAYKRIFGQIQQAASSSSTQETYTRIIDNELVGKPLPPADTKMAEADPMLCQHPNTAMKARGNRDTKWWTCLLCNSRWERTPLREHQGPATSKETATFGKYAGHTLGQIYQNDKQYCEWVLRTIESGDKPKSTGIMRLAQYIATREAAEAGGQQPEAEDDWVMDA